MAEFIWGINTHVSLFNLVSGAQQLDLAKSIGMTSLRVDVYDASPTTQAWLSALLEDAEDRGMTIFPVIVPSVAAATSEATAYTWGFQTASALAAAFPSLAWEVGNELDMYAVNPGKTGESTADYNDAIYAIIRGSIRGMSEGIHQTDPSASVAIGIAGIHFGFLQRLYNDGVNWDITSEHYYAPPDSTQYMEAGAHFLFSSLAKFGKPIVMTEFNQQEGYLLSQSEQVETLVSMMDGMKAVASQYNIIGAYIYELLDEPQLLPNQAHYGMANPTGIINATGLAIQQYLSVPVGLTVELALDTGSSWADRVTSIATISGTAHPTATLHFVVDGQAISSAVTADVSGDWTFNPTALIDGQHTILVSETTTTGATTEAAPFIFTLDTKAPAPIWTFLTTSNGVAALAGSTGGNAGESLQFFDGSALVGTGTTGINGAFNLTSAYNGSIVHVGTVIATDVAGNVGTTPNKAYLGSQGSDSISGSIGDDLILGNGAADSLTGGGGKDTFIYRAVSDSAFWGADTLTDFVHGVDKIDFAVAGINSSNGVPLFQGNIAVNGVIGLNPHSIGFLESDGNTWLVANITNNVQSTIADMRIILLGVGLGLTATDFQSS